VTERRGRRRRKLLGDLKERRGYFHLKERALERTKWRAALEETLNLLSNKIIMNEMMGQTMRSPACGHKQNQSIDTRLRAELYWGRRCKITSNSHSRT
jgi:hypothetical protein